MTRSDIRRRIDRLDRDPFLSAEDQVASLKQLFLDAQALQRAANEGGMIAETPHSADDLAAVEEALRQRGVDVNRLENSGVAGL